jgi:hypothetical protein
MRRLVVVPVVTLSMLAITACEGRGRNTQTQNVSNPRPVHCTIMADGPKRNAEPATSIVARVRYRCDNPGAETLTLALRLERKSGGAWVSVKADTVTAHGADTHAQFFKYRSKPVTIGCTAGQFRTVVNWTKVSRNSTTRGTVRSGTSTDPCAPRLFSASG